MIELTIDPEFRDKIPKPTEAEVEQLEKNMLRDGRLTDPIFTWHGFIVDGHTRYSIMQKHPDIDFKPRIERLDDMLHAKDEVIVWMCERQTGRRNITRQTRKILADTAYEAICRLRGSNQYQQKPKEGNPAGSSSSQPAEQIAERFNMSVPHVKHAIRFGRGVREIEKQAPGATDELIAGKSLVSDNTIEAFPSMTKEEQKEVVSALVEKRPLQKKEPKKRINKEDREKIEMIRRSGEQASDTSTHTEYTIEMLLDELSLNGDNYVSSLHNTLVIRSTLLVGENRDKVSATLDYIIKKIETERNRLK